MDAPVLNPWHAVDFSQSSNLYKQSVENETEERRRRGRSEQRVIMTPESVLSSRRCPQIAVEKSNEDEPKKETSVPHQSPTIATTYMGARLGQLAAAVAVVLVVMLLYDAFSRSEGLVHDPPHHGNPSRVRMHGNGHHEGSGLGFGSLGAPWCRTKHNRTVEWTKEDLMEGLQDFVPIYKARPIRNNKNGMLFDHSFGLWFMARWLQPELMIESGAFKGHSAWVLRQAMPLTPIISLSPEHPQKYLKQGPVYVDQNCTYLVEKDFVDFGSVDWKTLLKQRGVSDLGRVLVFFDDHQNELKRIKQALKAGFQHLIFEDNYDTGTGDHYSSRQICDQPYVKGGGHDCFEDGDEARARSRRKNLWQSAVDIDELCENGVAWWGVRGQMLDNFNHGHQMISRSEHLRNGRFLESVLDVYWELPPVAGPSLTHQTRYDPARSSAPVVDDGSSDLFRELGLSTLQPSVFNGYTHMVYLQVSAPTT